MLKKTSVSLTTELLRPQHQCPGGLNDWLLQQNTLQKQLQEVGTGTRA